MMGFPLEKSLLAKALFLLCFFGNMLPYRTLCTAGHTMAIEQSIFLLRMHSVLGNKEDIALNLIKKKRKISVWLALLLCMSMFLMPVSALEAAQGRQYSGIDVSRYQGEIDFAQVRQAGVEIVYIRAGEGADYEDPYFRENAKKAREAGLHYGFYLFVTAKTEAEARQQAQFFHELICTEEADCRPAMDFERLRGMSHAQINKVGQAFMEELEHLQGARPIIYTDAYAASHVWATEMGYYGLWVANYGVEEPDVPQGPWNAWVGFQYSDSGRVAGISDDVDLNRFTQGVLLYREENPPEQFIRYTVRRGDTLYRLAKQFDTTVQAIAERNALADPDRIYVGQILKIPVEREGDYLFYTVRHGDTLSALAKRYHTTVYQLVRLNEIVDPDRIYVGQVLRIPII